MTISYNMLEVTINRNAIRDNYTALTKRGGRCLGVIKADAYGHGLLETAQILEAAGADTLAAGTVQEAACLRTAGFGGRVVALLGIQSDDDVQCVMTERIVPFVFSLEQMRKLALAGSAAEPVAIALKFDTGMGRLGFSEAELGDIITALEAAPSVRVALVASHLAVADDPAHDAYTLMQQQAFSRIVSALRDAGHSFEASLANSGGLLAHTLTHYDLQRPGIALYGANPLFGQPNEAKGDCLQPAMSVHTPVLQVHGLKKGCGISYGLTYKAAADMQVAIVAAGYADGYSRGLSNIGQMVVNGYRVPVIGRVCMQTTAIDVTHVPSVQAGDTAWLLGGPWDNGVRAEELADWWQTCSYEVLCLLGMNPRVYR